MHLYPWFPSSLPITPAPALPLSCAQLNLMENKIGSEGAAALAPVIAVSSSLTSVRSPAHQLAPCTLALPFSELCLLAFAQLNLSSNSIGGYYPSYALSEDDLISTPEGPKAIAEALKLHASLTSVC